MADFFHRVGPTGEELEAMIRVGAFDEFGETRTRQFWQAQYLLKTFGAAVEPNQGWLVPSPGLELLPGIPLNEVDDELQECRLRRYPAVREPVQRGVDLVDVTHVRHSSEPWASRGAVERWAGLLALVGVMD